MKRSIKKRGQKFVQKFSRTTAKVSTESKEHIKKNLIERVSHIGGVKLLIFEWGLLVSALIMLAVAQAFWFADSYAEDSYTTGGAYSEGTLGEVGSLNPLFATTNSEKVLSRLMFATLTANDYSGHPGIGLAERISPSEGGKVWTVKLRDGLKWSDGEPITNEDVIFTVNLIKNPLVKSIYDANLSNVTVSENENGEVVFTLPSAYADFVAALNFPLLPKHKLEQADPKTLVEDNFSKSPVTSGPFNFNAVQATAMSNEKVYYLASNPDYYGGEPLINSFAVHTYPTREALTQALNTGTITATAELTDAESDEVTSRQLLKKNAGVNSGVYMFFNTRSAAVQNAEMRRAIRQGIDLEAIRAVSPETSPLDYPLLKSQIDIEKYPAVPTQDFDAAKEKIAALMGEEAANLEIATVNVGNLPEVANEIANQLQNLGFRTNVSIYEESQQDFVTRRAYDILVFEIGLGADPDLMPYYHSLHTGSAGLNLANYSSALVDDLLLGARDTLDETLRAKKYETFLNYWVNDVPAIGLYQSNLTYFYNRNARTFGDDMRLVTTLDRFTDVNNWAVNKEAKSKTP